MFSTRTQLSSLLMIVVGIHCSADSDVELFTQVPFIQALRPDNPATQDLFRFNSNDTVEFFDSVGGNYRLHFTRQGSHAVPAIDADSSGVPDFVEEAAGVYDEVIVFYVDVLGYDPPLSDIDINDNGGNGRFDVYLVDFAGQGDGVFRTDACLTENPDQCIGYMVQENDFVGYSYSSTFVANNILASHEFFHAIQAAYDKGQGSVLSEGTAVWATEAFNPNMNDFEGFIDGYLDIPDRSLDTPLPGPVDPFSYGSAIFFKFLEERFNADLVRAIWEGCKNGSHGVADPYWLEQLSDLLLSETGATFADIFTEFAIWNLHTSTSANGSSFYEEGRYYPPVAIETESLPYMDERLRLFYAATQYYGLPPNGRESLTASLVAVDDPEDITDLRLVLAVRKNNTYEEIVEVEDPTAGEQVVLTANAVELVVLVINTSTVGPSRRPGLCIGTTEEVRSCQNNLVPLKVPEPPEEEPEPSGKGGGCSVIATPVFWNLFLFPLFLVWHRHKNKNGRQKK